MSCNKPALNTMQWLTVIFTLIVGTWAIDARIQSTVAKLPPEWLVSKVQEDASGLHKVEADLASLRIAITDLSATTRELRERMKQDK